MKREQSNSGVKTKIPKAFGKTEKGRNTGEKVLQNFCRDFYEPDIGKHLWIRLRKCIIDKMPLIKYKSSK